MDLTEHIDGVAARVAGASTVVPVGARTHWGVGGPPPEGTEVSAPAGILRYEPADLTATVGAGTTVAELDAVLAEAGQECPLDPRDPAATVGGVLACGLSGVRRLGHGPVRDRVLEARFVTADGRVVKGGGPTVKNVSGYDVPRLLVGSLGTLGVLVQVTLRCAARPAVSRWVTSTEDPSRLRRERLRPSSLLWDGDRTWCLLEGHAADVDARSRRPDLEPADAPALPAGACRGRISVRPGAVAELSAELAAAPGIAWLAEIGVGTVHVAGGDPRALEASRAIARRHGGWLLREAGDGVDGFGKLDGSTRELARRLKGALDPGGKLNPGRLPW